MNQPVNLFFPYYTCGDEERQAEIDLSYRKNLECEYIDKLIVLVDDGSDLPETSSKVEVIALNQRPTYRDWVELSLEYSGISLLCNSDIYFDDTITLLNRVLSAPTRFLALSRWELQDSDQILHSNPHWSQDVWGINCKNLFSESFLKSLEFPMGVPRCDNKVAYVFATQGWSVHNPCKDVKSIHVHETQVRTYNKKLDANIIGGVAYVNPGEGLVSRAKLDFDVWTLDSQDIQKVSVNKTLERWINEDKEISSRQELSIASSLDFLQAVRDGELVYNDSAFFKVYEFSGKWYFWNLYLQDVRMTVPKSGDVKRLIPAGLIPPVLDTFIDLVSDQPKNDSDSDFWQYPCATERQAYFNHLNIDIPRHINWSSREVNIYLPIPWATYIDRKDFSSNYLRSLSFLLDKYSDLAEIGEFKLRVHTVCQHIHWVRILEVCKKIGITDLHLSHKDASSEEKVSSLGFSFDLHGWPLIAVNYETPSRNVGLEKKEVSEKRLLASFVGAYMKHYLNDDRLKLNEAAKSYGRDDVIVDLGGEWHFNKHVYQEQVRYGQLNSEQQDSDKTKTARYNALLSSSKFTLCPVGAGPNTLRLWEAISIGSIPVLFSNDLGVMEESEVGRMILDKSILWDRDLGSDLFEYLSSFDLSEISARSNELIKCYKKIRGFRAFGCSQ